MSSKKTIGLLTLINLIAAVLSIFYTVLQVHYFKFSRGIESFFAATMFLNLITSLSQSGMLSEIFLPVYHKLKKEVNVKAAHDAFSVVISWIITVTIIGGVFIFFGAPYITKLLVPGFESEYQQITSDIIRCFAFYFTFQISQTFYSVLLNAESVFGKTEFTQVVIVVTNIILIIFFHDSWGLWSMVFSLWVGKVLQMLYFIYLGNKLKYKFRFRLKTQGFDHKSFFSTMFSTIVYALSNQLFQIVLTAMVSYLQDGVYAVYTYVQQLFTKTNTILLRPARIVFFTEFSNQKLKDSDNQKETTRRALEYNLTISAIVLIFAASFGQTMLSFLWADNRPKQEFFELAYILLIVNFAGLLFLAPGGIYRQIVISYGLAKKYYMALSYRQLINCVIVAVSIYFLKGYGLPIMILVNAFMMEFITLIFIRKFAKGELVKFPIGFWLRLSLFVILSLGVGIVLERTFYISIWSGRSADFINLLIKSSCLGIFVYILGIWLNISLVLTIRNVFKKLLRKI